MEHAPSPRARETPFSVAQRFPTIGTISCTEVCAGPATRSYARSSRSCCRGRLLPVCPPDAPAVGAVEDVRYWLVGDGPIQLECGWGRPSHVGTPAERLRLGRQSGRDVALPSIDGTCSI